MKIIAITGATGFVGSSCVKYFAQKGYTIYAFGRNPHFKYNHLVKQYISWDISESSIKVDRVFDLVIHCAAGELYKDSVIGTQNVLETFHNCKQFIHISSSSVYDPYKSTLNLVETLPYGTQYLNEYSYHKMLAEVRVKDYSAIENRIILRPRAIHGLGDTTLLPRIRNARLFDRQLIIGNGRNVISLTYVFNIAYAIDLILEKDLKGFDVFNIADDCTVTVEDIIDTFNKTLGKSTKKIHVPSSLLFGVGWLLEKLTALTGKNFSGNINRYTVMQMSRDYTLNISKAKEILGYKPEITFKESFKQIAKNYREELS